MGHLLKIAQLGHPVLRTKSKPVNFPSSGEVQKIIEDLVTTVALVDGVGIAAPQVFESLRIFVIASRPNPRYPDAPAMAPVAMINPALISISPETEKDWEGCLSIPGKRGLVARSRSVRVRYTDCTGAKQEIELKGFPARIFQHELDHINGILFLDRLDHKGDAVTEREFRKRILSAAPRGGRWDERVPDRPAGSMPGVGRGRAHRHGEA
jgi:peptide deformylase